MCFNLHGFGRQTNIYLCMICGNNEALHYTGMSLLYIVQKKCKRNEKQKNLSTSFFSAYQSKVLLHKCLIFHVCECFSLHFAEEMSFVYHRVGIVELCVYVHA